MIIDTREEASTLRRTKVFIVMIYAVTVALTVLLLSVEMKFKLLFLGALSVAFLTFYRFQYKMEYTYFYFSNNNRNLVFRFYSMRNFHGKPKTIEIPKTHFLKYDLVTSFFNRKESLVLYQKTQKGVAKYPPISLTLLNKKQKTELKRTLFAMVSNQ